MKLLETCLGHAGIGLHRQESETTIQFKSPQAANHPNMLKFGAPQLLAI